MKYLAWTTATGDASQEPPQEVEMAVFASIAEMGLEMPAVRYGWHAEGKHGASISSERFPGAAPIWYWEV